MALQPDAQSSKPYLFLLARPSLAVRQEAAQRLRESGLKVVAQYGSVALEALATAPQARTAEELGLFSASLSGPMKDMHFERLNEEQRVVVRQWNTRFTDSYRKLKQDKTLVGKPWGESPDLAPPAPPSPVAPEDFEAFVDNWEKNTGRSATTDETGDSPGKGGRRSSRRPPSVPDDFSKYEEALRKQYGDPTVAYHLSRLGEHLGGEWKRKMLWLDPELLEALLNHFFFEAACWEMTGEMAVGLVFVESSRRGGPTFSTNERSEICQEILDGLTWLAAEHPGNNLSWVIDLQFTRIDVADGVDTAANCPGSSSLEAGWRDPAMAQVVYQGNTYNAAWSAVADYRDDMRVANRAAHAIAIFVTPYANCWHAYASSGRFVLARRNNWGNWGRGTIDTITAHEMSHLFGSSDEYGGSGTPCSTCDSLHGCDQIPNGNCAACSHPHQACMMDQNSRRICAYTRGHIGWSDLFVELTTADVLWAGTDDDVWLDIGDRTFVLDTPDHDDRERDNREGYAIWAPDLRREDIKRIMIRKSPDGFAGGWRLAHIRVWFHGQLICDTDVNEWLEDEDRTWVGCITDRDIVNTLEVRISTADVMWAGTDDDVTITLAGRDWNLDNAWHDDFERGNTDTFTLDPGSGLRISGLHDVRIHKSPDGFAGGWKLKGVRVLANGSDVYNNQSINRWLEDDNRTWSDSF
jgi:PLAT/LH2 domain